MEFIKIKNAFLHNLKHVNVEIPKNKFVVVTGVSGSGKTSLISDILDEVGCCEYLESLGLPQQTCVHDYYGSIVGLNPTVCVKSSCAGRWYPRSTVGTKTGILNYLRLFYLAEGEIRCLSCGKKNRPGCNCPICKKEIPSVESRQLSFNSPAGNCKKCNGMGYVVDVDFEIIRKNNHMTLPDLCTLIPECKPLKKQLPFFAEALHADLSNPLRKQPAFVVDSFLNGMQLQKSNFRGIGPYLVKLYSEGNYTGNLLHKRICPECKGDRLNKIGRSIKIGTVSLPEASQYSVTRLQDFIETLMGRNEVTELGKNIGKLLTARLNDLIRIGLGYLTLYRTIPSLSGGEYQRLKLASLLQSTMEDMVVIADEPLTGLHPTEKIQVLDQMQLLCEKGNNSAGACKFCGGTGSIQTAISEEAFMESKCFECNGTGYDRKVLKITYKGRNIAEIMEMTIAEAGEFFASEKKIQSILCELESLGLGYLTLGQPTPALSGGEAQRIKLLKSLLENDVVVLSNCHWIIEIGPGPDSFGGEVIAEGTPHMLKKNERSRIGKYIL